jgi:hypothetical protein
MWNIPGLKREQGGFCPEQSGPLLLVERVGQLEQLRMAFGST